MGKKEDDHRYYIKHKKELLAKMKRYIKAHPEVKKKGSKNYYWKHRAKELARKKLPQYKEKFKVYSKKYRLTHKEQLKMAHRLYRARPEVHERMKEKNKEYQRKPERKEWVKSYKSMPEVHEHYMALSRKYKHTDTGRAKARFYNERRREFKKGIVEGYSKAEFLQLLKETKGICPLCNNSFTSGYHSKHEMTIDHNPPVSKAPKGFRYTIKDIKLICRSCNAKKGNK